MDRVLTSVLKTMNKNLLANRFFQNYFRNIYTNLSKIESVPVVNILELSHWSFLKNKQLFYFPAAFLRILVAENRIYSN